MTGPVVELLLGEGVAHVTLNRPEAANTVNLALADSLLRVVEMLEDESPDAVVIAARGRAFCGGGDVREMADAVDLPGYLDRLAGTFHEALLRLSALDAVLIAVVEGAAAGGGLGLALSADVRIATPHARFLTAYETVGLTPDSGVSFLLPRAIGTGRSAAMSSLSQTIDATTAAACGLVTELLDAEAAPRRAQQLADTAARTSQSHVAATRRLLRGDTAGEYAAALDAERAALVRAASSPAAQSLIRGFARREKEKQS